MRPRPPCLRRKRTIPDLKEALPFRIQRALARRGIAIEALNRSLAASGHAGCTHVIDWALPVCLLHDALYRTGAVSRRKAVIALADEDDLLIWRWLGRARLWVRWAAGRLFRRLMRSWREASS